MHLVIEMGDLMWLIGGIAALYFLLRVFVSACVQHPEMMLPAIKEIYQVIKAGAKRNELAGIFENRHVDQAFARDFNRYRGHWNPDAYNNEPPNDRCIPVFGNAGQIFCGGSKVPVPIDETKIKPKEDVLFDEKEKDDTGEVKAGVEA
jgi:hypothetical protein